MFSEFNPRIQADMEAALERACAGRIEDHKKRAYVACHIIECARRGSTSLTALTEAAKRAAGKMTSFRNAKKAS